MAKSTQSNHTKSSAKVDHHPYAVAFEKTADARAKLAESDLLIINLDVQIALTTVIGAVPAIAGYRAAIKESLPHD